MSKVDLWSTSTEAVSLKQQSSKIDIEEIEIDYNSIPQSDTMVEVPSSEKTAIKLLRNQIVKTEKNDEVRKRSKYVILAGTSRAGTQLYLTGYDDSPECCEISAVPNPTTKTRCYELISLAKKKQQEKTKSSLLSLEKQNVTEFKIIEYIDPYASYNVSYEEIVARATEMIEDNRRKKNAKSS